MFQLSCQLRVVQIPFCNRNKIPCCFYDIHISGHLLSNKKGILVLDLKTRTLNFRKIPIWWRNYRNKEV